MFHYQPRTFQIFIEASEKRILAVIRRGTVPGIAIELSLMLDKIGWA